MWMIDVSIFLLIGALAGIIISVGIMGLTSTKAVILCMLSLLCIVMSEVVMLVMAVMGI